MNLQKPLSIAGAIFSSDRTQVLLIQRRDVPVWVLPGGGIDPGETPIQAITREILEETGFHVKVERLVGNYYPINRIAYHTHLYECKILSGAMTTSKETRNLGFFPLDALPKAVPPPHPDWIRDAFVIREPVTRKLASVTYTALLKNLFLHPLLVLRFLLSRLGLPLNTK